MLMCPKCNSEYQEGCTICSDCQCELIEEPEVKEEDVPVKMDTQLKKSIISAIMVICLFLGGSILSFVGLTKGLDIASSLSRPQGATGWIIPDKLILGCTYTPIIIGVSFIVLSISLSTVMFVKWINKSN